MAVSATPNPLPILYDAAFRWLQRDSTRTAASRNVLWHAEQTYKLEQQPRTTETDLRVLLSAGRVASAARLSCVAACKEAEPRYTYDQHDMRSFNMLACIPMKAYCMSKYTSPQSCGVLRQSDLGIAVRELDAHPTNLVDAGRKVYREGVRFFIDKLVERAVWQPYAPRQPVLPHPMLPDYVLDPITRWNPSPGALDEWRSQMPNQTM